MSDMMGKISSIAKHGQDVKSIKMKDGSKKLKVKFDKSSPREVALKKMKAHLH